MNDRRGDMAPGVQAREKTDALKADNKSEPITVSVRQRVRKWYLIAAAVVLICIAGTTVLFLLGPKVAVYQVTRHDLIQTVVASGHIETPYRVNIGSQITGVVAQVPVEEGQAVKAGDVLIRLDDHELSAVAAQARAAVTQAEQKLRQIRDVLLVSAELTLKQAQATAANATASYNRAVKLLRNGYMTQADFDTIQRDYNIAVMIERNAALQVSTNRPGGSDYVMAETQLIQARANLSVAEAKEGYTVIVAPVDGRLITRNVERGNVVNPSDILMVLAPTGEMRIDLDIDERDVGLLRLGQSALASADAYPNQTFAAEVVYINPGVDIQRASVLVKLRVLSPPPYLIQDMTVSADIEVGRHNQALTLPTAAVHDIRTTTPWVLVSEDGRLSRRDVVVGMISDDKLEVVSGLKEGDLVVPASDAKHVAGDKIRPVVTVIPGS